jgi:hypothetical protein
MGWRQRAIAWLERMVSMGKSDSIPTAWSRARGGVRVQRERGRGYL